MPSMEDIEDEQGLHRWRWVAVTAIAPIAWGSNYYVTRQFLPEGEPFWGALLRALPAGLLLLALARSRPRGSWWWKSVLLGMLNVGAFFVLIYVTSGLLPTSIASTIMATSAGVLMLLAWPLIGERPSLLPALGAVVGLIGVGMMVLDDTASVDPVGVVTSLTAMVSSSVGFILTKRWAVGQKTIAVTSWQLIAGGLLLLPFAYVSVVATAVAFVAWFSGLRHLPAATVGLIGLLNPVTGVLLGTVVASEVFGIGQGLGVALVLAGVLLGRRSSRRAVITSSSASATPTPCARPSRPSSRTRP